MNTLNSWIDELLEAEHTLIESYGPRQYGSWAIYCKNIRNNITHYITEDKIMVKFTTLGELPRTIFLKKILESR